MSDQYARVKVKNHTKARVMVQFYHHNHSYPFDGTTWVIEAGTTNSGSLKAHFNPSKPGTDDWFLVVNVPKDADGVNAGTYISSAKPNEGSIAKPSYAQCQLRSADAYDSAGDLEFAFDSKVSEFTMVTSAGTVNAPMRKFRDYQSIQHVFVVMLENRSYDNMLGYAGIEGATPSPAGVTNTAYGVAYPAQVGAKATTVFDPGHEFHDVLVQLSGNGGEKFTPGQDYPTPNPNPSDTGFALSYANKRRLDGEKTLRYALDGTSPSVDTYGNIAVMSFAQESNGVAMLTVLSPQSEKDSNREYSSSQIASGTNSDIALLSADPDSWVAAYSTRNGHNLYVQDYDGTKNLVSKDYGLASKTSPSITRYGSGQWAVAIQNYGSGNDQSYATLRVVQSDGTTFQDTEVMRAGANPTICTYHHDAGWAAAFVENSSGTIYIMKSTSGTPSKPLNTPKVNANTSPCISYQDKGGHYAIAFQNTSQQLCLYMSEKSTTYTYDDCYVCNGTSPSVYWSVKEGGWVIAYVRKSDLVLVVTVEGASSNPAFEKRKNKVTYATNPCIAPLGGEDGDRNVPNYVVGYNGDSTPEAVNAKGLPYIVQAPPSEVMTCFDTKTQLPVMYTLATEFTTCDQWFSSLPGPTWPNRDFVHAATSGGLDDSPEPEEIAAVMVSGFNPPGGNIYQRIQKATWPGSSEKLAFHFYQDCEKSIADLLDAVISDKEIFGHHPIHWLKNKVKSAAHRIEEIYHFFKELGNADNFLSIYSDKPKLGLAQMGGGYVPQVLSMAGVGVKDFSSMRDYEGDLTAPYDAAYTFIEPHYGDLVHTFRGGSSQHPRDNTYGGEALLKDVYEKLRNSPLWYSSMLVVTYDEHGGFFDHVAPGPSAPPEGCCMKGSPNGFKFDYYGVRVPGIVISPLVKQGVATSPSGGKPLYCHASVPSTLRSVFNLGDPLNERDASANSLTDLVTLSIADNTYRSDCPTSLPSPVAGSAPAPPSAQVFDQAEINLDSPIAPRSNLVGALGTLAGVLARNAPTKALADGVWALHASIRTKRDVLMFLPEVNALMATHKA